MSTDKHPESVPALLSSLRHLRDTNAKAVRANVHIYPVSLYANNGESSSSSSSSSSTSTGTKGGLRDRKITSWKMTEHMYFNASNPFPTLARGLFTEHVEDTDPLPEEQGTIGLGIEENGTRPEDRIVARGYDKFFNIDEVAWTNWSAMKRHTEPPYHLTLKSNGCLILISALSPVHLLVASKHSLGTTTEAQEQEKKDELANGLAELSVTKEKNKVKKGKSEAKEEKEEHEEARAHAAVGREWVKKTLTACGKSEADLARRLWEGNMTAVLELCDDSFEEHVIATPAHWTGLHLHGLNHNTPHFSTSTPAEVTAFAKEFGFIETKFVELQTLDEVKSFTDEVAKTGSWEGDMIEGFVVRCRVRKLDDKDSQEGKPPYRPGAPFFFKVKFDEPYLLYRQWREMTRIMLPLLEETRPEGLAAIWKKVRSRTKRPEIGVYAEWVGRMIKSEPHLFDNYDKGVVRVRDRFLAWTEGEGKKDWEEARLGKGKKVFGETGPKPQKSKDGLPKKYLIVPIAVPGCGKTLIGVTLAKLFGFGHTQSDDVTTKKTAPTFIKNITALLQKNDVVYADRNNHIVKHYEELAAIASSKPMNDYDLRLIGVVWDISSHPYHRLLRVCSERVVARGDNHQTLRPDPTVDAEHEAVVGQFLRNFTSPDPALFEELIPVGVLNTPRQVLGKIVDGLSDICKDEDKDTVKCRRPTDQEMDEALDSAATYKPTTPFHAIGRVGKPIRYFGLAPEIDLAEIVEAALSTVTFSPQNELVTSAREFLQGLKDTGRVTSKPHVTLSHEKNVQAEREEAEAAGVSAGEITIGPQTTLWNTCKALAEAKFSTLFEYDLTHLIWDKRIMTLALANLRPKVTGSPSLSSPTETHIDTRNDVDANSDSKVENSEDTRDLHSVLPDEVRSLLHVTVGTASEDVAPFESRSLMSLLRGVTASAAGEVASGVKGEHDEVVEGGGKVRWVKIGPIKGEGRVRGMY